MLFRQPGWRFCSKCCAFFFGPGPAGVCPADRGRHDPGTSGAYVLHNLSMSRLGEVISPGPDASWQYCHKCSVLFQPGTTRRSCPVGGLHDGSTSGVYWVYRAVTASRNSGFQLGWARCEFCASMFFNGNVSHGACPGNPGSPHIADATANYGMFTACSLDDHVETKLMIVSADVLASAVEPLAVHRRATGTTARLVRLSECLAHFWGADDAARLRSTITYGNQYLGVNYVLLVGDASLIPVRYRYIQYDTSVHTSDNWRKGTYAPTDLYYANLYGGHAANPDGTISHGLESNWDANNNGRYNEQIWGGNQALNNPDMVDGFIDVAVGRLPTSDSAGVIRYVSKLIAFENGSARRYDFTVGLIADGNYWPDATFDIPRFETLANFPGTAWPSIQRVWFNGTADHPAPADFSAAASTDTIAPIVANSGWVVYLGHGSYSNWDVPGADRSDVAAQQAVNVPIVVCIGCQTGQIANNAPDGPGGYNDRNGNRHEYALTTSSPDWASAVLEDSGPPVQQWRLASTGAIDVAEPNVYQPTLDRPTVAAEWLHAQQAGGAVVYFGEQTVAPDDSGAELMGRMLGAAVGEGGRGQILGDLWLRACRGYWSSFITDPRDIPNARIYLGYMTLYGDPSLHL